ncbi:MAG: mRNA surveillance protein pelota [Candidatus Bathyarchaeota archaeon]|nr:mRNA surveillance protein pelota [Candidatus Bathyarchaeota archaeon]MDH5622913.1 mRNA surveillance protein pelota [Candidatus Bathyarchaeota archaeon]MDH5635324.1 mRNA surveillance protein pelota [Candidatus Bathyarchaeota archaeon]MDH5701163.1 mRNA surveillance protein pelota [Candidatus Bathyarchaeota archaeon]
MKILQMNLKKGIAKVLPESLDDLWHLYNIILQKDTVHARTTREVKVEDHYARPKKGKRVPVFLGVEVEKVLWDKILNRLRIHGIVCEAPEKISIKGSRHTIDVTVNKPITIVKTEWPKHQIDRLKRASRVTAAPLVIMSIDDEEYCVAVLRQYGIDVKAEEKTRLPGKLEAEKRTKATSEFFKTALKSLREAWISLRSPIVIIGPGFIKNDFSKYVRREALDVANAVIDVKGVNNAGVAGIHEALRSGVFTKALKHVRIAEETKVMEEVLARLGKGRRDITYGFVEVEKASAYGAVEKLLVADTTLRETPDEKRKALEKIMKEVEEKGGQIMVISTEHEAGTQLLSLGGVAALLRFPLG